ncbi:MAG: GNAT family N-acetyltransferase, partial [Planctomycetota bacterium]
FSEGELAAEVSQVHHAFVDAAGAVAACCCVKMLDSGYAKIRQMAVDPQCQRRGLGRRLIRQVIEAHPSQRLWELNARDEAVAFYRKVGFREEGLPFRELGIQHQRMSYHAEGAAQRS